MFSTWEVLERLKLADFFDEHNIPPLAFPISILILLLLIVLVLFQPASIPEFEEVCGNGKCSSDEDSVSCPDDCKITKGTTKDIIVTLSTFPLNEVTVRLETTKGVLIQKVTGTKDNFHFSGIDADAVIATIRNLENSKTLSSSLVFLDDETTEIYLSLPTDFFEIEVPPKKTATLKVLLRDSQTDISLHAKVAVLIKSKGSYSVVDSRSVSGQSYFTLEANKWYAIVAEADDYELYNGESKSFTLAAGSEREVLVYMNRLTTNSPEQPRLEDEIANLSDYIPTDFEDDLYLLDEEDMGIMNLPEYEFRILELSYSNPVVVSSEFEVVISRVLYGQTDITGLADFSVELAGNPCDVITNLAYCIAPSEEGEYDLLITTNYLGYSASRVEQIDVLEYGARNMFSITQFAVLDTTPPLTMDFDINFNGTALDSLSDSAVTIDYDDGGVRVGTTELSGEDGIYSFVSDSPFPGDHRSEMYLMKEIGDKLYEQNFTFFFESNPRSVLLDSSTAITPQILEPEERFTVYLTLTDDGAEISSLQNVYVQIDGQRTWLDWDSDLHAYVADFRAPTTEGIFKATFGIGYSELEDMKFYVIDTTSYKSEECPISDCKTHSEVRMCVDKHRSENFYSQDDTIQCIEKGWPLQGVDIACFSSEGNRGDWNNDCTLTSFDITLMQNALKKVIDQKERNIYSSCGDMDKDGDVDNDDSTCLTNVVSMKWLGDGGDGTCSKPMSGGFCFDISLNLPGDFNDNDNFDDEDLGIMRNVKTSVSRGVRAPEELLTAADFNRNSVINSEDYDCLEQIVSSGNIDGDCLLVYGFSCNGVHADLTGNGITNEIDLLIERWILDNRVDSSSVFTCADSNDDGKLNEDDYECMNAMSENNFNDMEEFCNPCQLEMQRLGRYGQEICHDGLDNDCDGRTDSQDSRCSCSESTPCSMLYDVDGVDTTNDFKLCRKFGEADFSRDTLDEDGSWEWFDVEDIGRKCNDEDNWGNIMYCGGGEATCLYKYQVGFSMNPLLASLTVGENYDAEKVAKFYFEWRLAEGNIGPLGVAHENAPFIKTCPDLWTRVGPTDTKCVYCRHNYDVCTGLSCGGVSGTSVDTTNCNLLYPATYTEICPAKHSCMGYTEETERGLGRFDNRYGSGFLWIPISGPADGKLRVVVPGSPTKVYIANDPIAHFGIIEEGRATSEGYVFSKTGIEYGTCYVIAEYGESKTVYHIPTGAAWHYPGSTVRF